MSAAPTDKAAWQRENAKQRDAYYVSCRSSADLYAMLTSLTGSH